MNTINRRDFLRHSVVATAAVGAAGVALNARGANDKVIIGVMGCGGRGTFLANEFAERDDVEIRYVTDPDSRRAENCANIIEKTCGKRPKPGQDFRRILDDPEVHGMINATPDHWHALGTILACQAGKDVYVEKPASHSIWEGRKMVEAARKYKRVVQVGTQNRSAEYCYKAYEYLHSAAFGDIHFVRVLNSKLRSTIGKKADKEVPPGIDYDMWLGPAPMRPFNENHFHYAWHWFWNYSGGDIINDGIHQIDLARWMIGLDYPKTVSSGGGIFYYDDDQETPDTHTVSWNYDKLTISFEQTLWSPYLKKIPMEVRDLDTLPNWPFYGCRIEIYGAKQIMYLARHGSGWQVFDADEKSVAIQPGRFTEANLGHVENFISCIRSRELPNGDIEKVHLSTLLSHYGNIAYRTGRRLHIDPQTEGFVNDDEANALVKRTYRSPWVVPEQV